MRSKSTPSVLSSAVLGAAFVVGIAVPARAEISFVDTFRNNSFTQTGNENSLSIQGSFLSFRLTSAGPNDYNTVQATYPGPGSAAALSPVDATHFLYQTGFYPTQAAMDTEFPTGIYTIAGRSASGSDATSFDYSTDAYPLTLPYLTGANYTELQRIDVGAPFTFQFSPFTPNPSANEAFLFFTIFDYTANAIVFDAGFQPSTTTGLTLPANTLLPGRQYAYELIFSDRVFVPSPGAAFDAQIGFDLRTTGVFATPSVPEPSSLLMVVIGLLACGWRYRAASTGSSAVFEHCSHSRVDAGCLKSKHSRLPL
jgi:hypothetical protein